jgi:Rieske Fe-S protein
MSMGEREPETTTTATRRSLFAGAVGAGALLAACGPGDGGTVPQPPPGGNGSRDGGSAGNPGPGGGETDEPDRPEGFLAEVADVEVGGGFINSGENVVVTQPTDGDFRGFRATCTHEGCRVTGVQDGTINCPCHGSRYSIEDGSVVQAAIGLTPATQSPLPEVAVVADGDVILRA